MPTVSERLKALQGCMVKRDDNAELSAIRAEVERLAGALRDADNYDALAQIAAALSPEEPRHG
jgi:hypothetical protein